MSLEDKFYPEDGTLLTRFDNFMIKSCGKIGEAYQHLTGKSYKELARSCYKVSAKGALMSVGGLQIGALLLYMRSQERHQSPDFSSPLEEEILDEIKNHSKKYSKLNRVSGVGATNVLFLCSYLGLKYGIERDKPILIWYGAGVLVYGASCIPYVFAEYLSRSHMPDPPKKTVWARAKDRLSYLLTPQPTPVPVKNYVSAD